jgi:hypothetical protein
MILVLESAKADPNVGGTKKNPVEVSRHVE